MKLYVIDEKETMYSGQRGEGRTIYREATEEEVRNAFQAIADCKAEERRRARMTDAEKDLEAIKEMDAQESYERGNKIIRDRNLWKQGGSMFGAAEYEYWDGSKLKWRDTHPIHPPYWG